MTVNTHEPAIGRAVQQKPRILRRNLASLPLGGRHNNAADSAAQTHKPELEGELTVSYTNLLLHVVFGTKGRLPLLNESLEPQMHSYLGGIVRNLGGTAFEINGIEDHVHLLVKVPPTIAVSDFLRKLKSSSSKWANENFRGRFAWQRRYGAFSVSASMFEQVRKYIRRQKEHHRRFDFKTEMEELVRASGLELDPNFWRD